MDQKKKQKKESKAETIERLSPSENVTVLAILESLEIKNFSCRLTMVAAVFHGPSTLKLISPVLLKFKKQYVFCSSARLKSTFLEFQGRLESTF